MNTLPRAPRASAPALVLVLALAAGPLLAPPAHAEALTVRDTDSSRWQVIENPDDDKDSYVLQKLGPDRKPDIRYGHQGATEFELGPDNDSPATLRVDAATHRAWVTGTSSTGNWAHAVVMRFGPDGNIDPRWGVQGRIDSNPSGLQVHAKDVLPLEDGSALVAGEEGVLGATRAVVFHLKVDGSVDMNFGQGGVWLRPGTDPAVAGSLAVGPNGGVAASVIVRGSGTQGEVWSLDKGVPTKLSSQPLDDGIDEDEARIEWALDHWTWLSSVGTTPLVPAATLNPRPIPVATAPVGATSDPGNVAYNPFVEAPRNAAPAKAHDDDGLPWLWIGIAAMLALGLTALFFKRAPAATTRRQNFRR